MSEWSSPNRPILRFTATPKMASDLERLHEALRNVAQGDVTIAITSGASDGQILVAGMTETQLAGICGRIVHEFQIPIDAGPVEVVYLETIRASAEAEGKYLRHTGGSGNYGHCVIRVSPNGSGQGYKFTDDIQGAIPEKYVEAVDQGIREAMLHGVLAGYEVVDVQVSLYDGSYHETDSNEMAFKIAGAGAFRNAVRKAKPVLLEPIMAVEIAVREEYLGAIIGGLNSRRGRIEAIERRAGSQVVKAYVPLSQLFGYAEFVDASTRGSGSLSVRFARYEVAPLSDEWGGAEPGVAAIRPKRPKGPSGSAAARLDDESQ